MSVVHVEDAGMSRSQHLELAVAASGADLRCRRALAAQMRRAVQEAGATKGDTDRYPQQLIGFGADEVVIGTRLVDDWLLSGTAEILKFDPEVKILILSMYSNDAYVRKAFELGAKGYMLKNAIEVDLNRAVKALAEGQAYFSPGVSHIVLESMKAGSFRDSSQEPYEKLTLREKEVLQLIAQGKSNKEIATLLNISVNTVAVHRARVMETLGLHRTAELVLFAVKKGLIQPE